MRKSPQNIISNRNLKKRAQKIPCLSKTKNIICMNKAAIATENM